MSAGAGTPTAKPVRVGSRALEPARLGVVVDGVPMADDDARAVWQKFSAHMEEHRGDLAGFAQAEGFASVHPRSDGGRAVLALSRTAPQEAYGSVGPAARPPGGGAAGPNGRRRR